MSTAELHTLSLELREWSAALATGRPAVLMARAAIVVDLVLAAQETEHRDQEPQT